MSKQNEYDRARARVHGRKLSPRRTVRAIAAIDKQQRRALMKEAIRVANMNKKSGVS